MAIINLTKETFKQQISEVDKPVIVDFWAPWCTYCRRIAPAFDKIASQQEDKLIFAKLDIDDAAEIAEESGAKAESGGWQKPASVCHGESRVSEKF